LGLGSPAEDSMVGSIAAGAKIERFGNAFYSGRGDNNLAGNGNTLLG
jgi:hypothetical protein